MTGDKVTSRGAADWPVADVPVLGITRQSISAELLATAASHALDGGPRSTGQLVHHVRNLWPGARLDAPTMRNVMETACRAGYATELRRNGENVWAATSASAESASAREQVREAIDEAARAVRDVAHGHAFLENLSLEESRRMVWIVLRGVSEGLAASLATTRGDVSLRGGLLVPDAFDHEAMMRKVRRSSRSEAEARFVVERVLEALDPGDRFLRGPVQGLITAHLQQAFLANRDRLRVRGTVGSLRGQWAFLDTPCLVPMLGLTVSASDAESLVEVARDAGMAVVVLDHILDELRRMLAGVEWRHGELISAIEGGRAPSELAGAVADQSVLGIFWQGVDAGRWESWSEFAARGDHVEQRLDALGVIRQAHRSAVDADRFSRCLRELLAEIGGRFPTSRGRHQIERDAHTMAAVWNCRERYSDPDRFLPSAWMVTPDRRIPPAYAGANADDSWPLTLTESQLVGLVAACADPVDLDELRALGGAMLAREAVLAVAAHYSPDSARALAGELSDDDGSTASLLDMPAEARGALISALGDTPASRCTQARTFLEQRHERRMAALRWSHDRQTEHLEGRLGTQEAALAGWEARARAQRLAVRSATLAVAVVIALALVAGWLGATLATPIVVLLPAAPAVTFSLALRAPGVRVESGPRRSDEPA